MHVSQIIGVFLCAEIIRCFVKMHEPRKMKKIIGLLMLVAPLLFSSCWNDEDEDTVLQSYCYIKRVTLGTLKRAIHTTDSLGRDSIYYTSFTASGVVMAIDHLACTIENRDSLLFETQLKSVPLSITYDASSLTYRHVGEGDDAWVEYDESDSLDLTTPIELLATAQDGINQRKYTLKLNVHQVESDSLYWSRMDTEATPFEGMSEMSATTLDGMLQVLGRTTTGIQLAERNGIGSTGQWTVKNTNLPQETIVESLMKYDQTLFVSASDGSIYESQDGQQWNTLGVAQEGLRLVAKTDNFYYALLQGRLCRSTDAVDWIEESLDDSPDWLPTCQIHYRFYQQDNGNNRVTLCGACSPEDKYCQVWSKMWQKNGSEKDTEWTYFCQTRENPYNCPRLDNLVLLPYDSKMWAIGGAGAGYKAFEYIFISNDHGITWRPDADLHLPSEMLGVGGPFAATVDENNYIWLFAGNQVWRGRINRLGFARS